MSSKKSPIHDSPPRARDEQPVVATGIKVDVPEERSTDPNPKVKTDPPSSGWQRYRLWIILIGAVTAIFVVAVLLGFYSVE